MGWVVTPLQLVAALVTMFKSDSGGGDQPIHIQCCNVSKQALPLGPRERLCPDATLMDIEQKRTKGCFTSFFPKITSAYTHTQIKSESVRAVDKY